MGPGHLPGVQSECCLPLPTDGRATARRSHSRPLASAAPNAFLKGPDRREGETQGLGVGRACSSVPRACAPMRVSSADEPWWKNSQHPPAK